MSQPIKEVMEAIDKNIKGLEEVKDKIDLDDVRTLLIDLYGIIKNLWGQLEDVFIYTEEIKKIEEATLKGERFKDGKELINSDVKRMTI